MTELPLYDPPTRRASHCHENSDVCDAVAEAQLQRPQLPRYPSSASSTDLYHTDSLIGSLPCRDTDDSKSTETALDVQGFLSRITKSRQDLDIIRSSLTSLSSLSEQIRQVPASTSSRCSSTQALFSKTHQLRSETVFTLSEVLGEVRTLTATSAFLKPSNGKVFVSNEEQLKVRVGLAEVVQALEQIIPDIDQGARLEQNGTTEISNRTAWPQPTPFTELQTCYREGGDLLYMDKVDMSVLQQEPSSAPLSDWVNPLKYVQSIRDSIRRPQGARYAKIAEPNSNFDPIPKIVIEDEESAATERFDPLDKLSNRRLRLYASLYFIGFILFVLGVSLGLMFWTKAEESHDSSQSAANNSTSTIIVAVPGAQLGSTVSI